MDNNENERPEQGNVLEKYQKQKAIEGIKAFMEDLKESLFSKGKPVKSIPMKAAWQKAWDELEAARVAHEIADRKHSSLKDYFWALVHKDTDDMRGMKFNPKKGEIEIFDDIENHED